MNFNSSDWQAIGSMLQGVGTVGGAFAVWWVARKAVTDWREQRQVELQIQAADQILVATYDLAEYAMELSEPIEWYRNVELEKEEYLNPKIFSQKTFEDHKSKSNKLVRSVPLAMTYFGPRCAELMKEFDVNFMAVCIGTGNVELSMRNEDRVILMNSIRGVLGDRDSLQDCVRRIEQEISQYIRKI